MTGEPDHRKEKHVALRTSRNPRLHAFWKKYHEIILAVLIAFLIAQLVTTFL